MAARHSRGFYRALGQYRAMSEKSGTQNWLKDTSDKLFKASKFYKYGLLYDDTITQYEVVKKAVRRLPPDVEDDRNFRMARAMQLHLNKQYLPKEEWTEPGEHNYYLQPYILRVEEEEAEKAGWAQKM